GGGAAGGGGQVGGRGGGAVGPGGGGGGEPVGGGAVGVGEHVAPADLRGLQSRSDVGRRHGRPARADHGDAEQGQGRHRDGADRADHQRHRALRPGPGAGAGGVPRGIRGDRGQRQRGEGSHLDEAGGDPRPRPDRLEAEQPDPARRRVGAEGGQGERRAGGGG